MLQLHVQNRLRSSEGDKRKRAQARSQQEKRNPSFRGDVAPDQSVSQKQGFISEDLCCITCRSQSNETNPRWPSPEEAARTTRMKTWM